MQNCSMRTGLLDTLQSVPHLLSSCSNNHILKELRSICSEARLCAVGLITGLTVDFEDPCSTLRTPTLLALLKGSRLQRLCVVIHLERHEDTERHLLRLADYLHEALSSVTRLSIQLKGDSQDEDSEDDETYPNDTPPPNYPPHPVIHAAAVAIRILGPRCGALTHITVSGKVYFTQDEICCTGVLDAASTVSASSLTHFSLGLLKKHSNSTLANPAFSGDPDQTIESSHGFMLHTNACKALASFSCLAHLSVKRGWIDDTLVWAGLPQSLQSLHIQDANQPPPRQGWLLPHLRELTLNSSSCEWLKRLLDACPQLLHMHLTELTSPTSVEELAGLDQIMNHVAWHLNDRGGAFCIPVTRFVQSYDNSYQPRHLPPWTVLASLPTMPCITHFKFDLNYQQEHHDPMTVTADILRHIPRAFPNLHILDLGVRLQGNPSLDLDLFYLHGCTALRELHMSHGYIVNNKIQMLLLAAALPELVSMDGMCSKLIAMLHGPAVLEVIKACGQYLS